MSPLNSFVLFDVCVLIARWIELHASVSRCIDTVLLDDIDSQLAVYCPLTAYGIKTERAARLWLLFRSVYT